MEGGPVSPSSSSILSPREHLHCMECSHNITSPRCDLREQCCFQETQVFIYLSLTLLMRNWSSTNDCHGACWHQAHPSPIPSVCLGQLPGISFPSQAQISIPAMVYSSCSKILHPNCHTLFLFLSLKISEINVNFFLTLGPG